MSFIKPTGYGEWPNYQVVAKIKNLPDDEKMEYIKNLFLEDPDKYFEWKAWCIRCDRLPDIFGTRDNPKDFDESKL